MAERPFLDYPYQAEAFCKMFQTLRVMNEKKGFADSFESMFLIRRQSLNVKLQSEKESLVPRTEEYEERDNYLFQCAFHLMSFKLQKKDVRKFMDFA